MIDNQIINNTVKPRISKLRMLLSLIQGITLSSFAANILMITHGWAAPLTTLLSNIGASLGFVSGAAATIAVGSVVVFTLPVIVYVVASCYVAYKIECKHKSQVDRKNREIENKKETFNTLPKDPFLTAICNVKAADRINAKNADFIFYLLLILKGYKNTDENEFPSFEETYHTTLEKYKNYVEGEIEFCQGEAQNACNYANNHIKNGDTSSLNPVKEVNNPHSNVYTHTSKMLCFYKNLDKLGIQYDKSRGSRYQTALNANTRSIAYLNKMSSTIEATSHKKYGVSNNSFFSALRKRYAEEGLWSAIKYTAKKASMTVFTFSAGAAGIIATGTLVVSLTNPLGLALVGAAIAVGGLAIAVGVLAVYVNYILKKNREKELKELDFKKQVLEERIEAGNFLKNKLSTQGLNNKLSTQANITSRINAGQKLQASSSTKSQDSEHQHASHMKLITQSCDNDQILTPTHSSSFPPLKTPTNGM